MLCSHSLQWFGQTAVHRGDQVPQLPLNKQRKHNSLSVSDLPLGLPDRCLFHSHWGLLGRSLFLCCIGSSQFSPLLISASPCQWETGCVDCLVLSSLTQSSEIQCIKWVGKCWKVCIILSNSRENIFLETIFPKMV